MKNYFIMLSGSASSHHRHQTDVI